MYPSRSKSTSMHDSLSQQPPRVRATVLFGVRYSVFHIANPPEPFSSGWIMDRHESVKEVTAESSFAPRCDGVAEWEMKADCGCV